MTEHDHSTNTMLVIDGCKEFSGTSLKCESKLHALAEYVDSDISLSNGVMDDLALWLQEKGWSDTTIELVEGYDSEKEGEEHYRLSMLFNGGSDNNKVTFSKHYSAQTEGEGEIKGLVRVKACLPSDSVDDHKELTNKVAEIYIKWMEETYTDWKNQWEEGRFNETV